jgi:type II secretory pathway component PulF
MARSLGAEDLAELHRDLVELVRIKAPLPNELRRLAHRAKRASLEKAFSSVAQELEKGTRLAAALETAGVPTVYARLVEAGEHAGDVRFALELVAQQSESDVLLRANFLAIFVYPALIWAFTLVITVLVLLGPLSQFEQIFNTMNIELPALTSALMDLASLAERHSTLTLVSEEGHLPSSVI